jgi:hypothetical protein
VWLKGNRSELKLCKKSGQQPEKLISSFNFNELGQKGLKMGATKADSSPEQSLIYLVDNQKDNWTRAGTLIAYLNNG